jgi:hypothetical protein
MTLYGIVGDARVVNRQLLNFAFIVAPAIFIDANNCSNIHKFPNIEIDKFQKLYLLQAESLYRFKPTLLKVANIAKSIGTQYIFISTSSKLFAYDNDTENNDIYSQAWKIIHWLSKSFEVYVGIIPPFNDGTYKLVTTDEFRYHPSGTSTVCSSFTRS